MERKNVQAVPVPVSGGDPCGAAVYDWCPNRDWLAAAGRASPAVAHIWNLHSEKRDLQVNFNASDDHNSQPPFAPCQVVFYPRSGSSARRMRVRHYRQSTPDFEATSA